MEIIREPNDLPVVVKPGTAKSKFRSALATFCGVLAALGAIEIAMRPLSFQIVHRTKYEMHQYLEGTSVSHYFHADPVPRWFRDTGNDMIMGAENLLMVGDSYLTARSIPDHATMGSLIESRSRAEGNPLNIVQCDFSSGTAATYAGFADSLMKTWKPKRVIVLLNDTDLGEEVFTNSEEYRLKFSPTGAPQIYKYVEHRKSHKIWLEEDSAVLQTLHPRLDLILMNSAKGSFQRRKIDKDANSLLSKIPKASVTLLKQAYGEKLIVIFFPEMRMDRHSEPGEPELQLEKECALEDVPFASCRNEFVKLRQKFIYVHGFHNTLPGDGHLNEKGHRVMAEVIWKLLNRLDEGSHTAQKIPAGDQR